MSSPDAPEVERVDKVTAYRQEVLECAGYEPADALVLATNRDIDLHGAVALVRSGCPSATAVRILV